MSPNETDQADIIRLVRDGARFPAIEEHIDWLTNDDEARSWLWLLAWSELPWRQRKRIMRLTMPTRN